MIKKELLQMVTFGESVAELEAAKLKDYFLQTEFWYLVRNGTNDIVYGAKGTGKSAIYTSITNDVDSLFDEGILVALAENPSGNTAFSDLRNDPPTSQTEFIRLWKLYFLVITANIFKDYGINDDYAQKVNQILIDCNLIPAQNKLSSFLKACFDFVKSFKNGKEISTTAEFDSISGQYSGQKFSLVFGEPSKSDFERGLIPVEYVYGLLSKSLERNNIKLWIIVDRLDVAFLESEALETNALRALFKVYLDLYEFSEIKLKIFLRDDIWSKLTSDGFREASHITKFQYITWSKDTLLNLIIRRLLDNMIITQTYSIKKEEVLISFERQEELFYRFFPKQVDIGAKKPTTLDWIISRTRDGNGVNTPREIIQLLNHAKMIEIKRLENGIDELREDILISRQSIKDAVSLVSKQRLEQTIYAEFSVLKNFIEKLRGDKAEHTESTLAFKWNMSHEETAIISKKLCEIGFFEVKGNPPNHKFKIPFIYRPYLEITQGAALNEED